MIEIILQQIEKNKQRLEEKDSFRILHGRGGRFPGLQWLNLDFYYPVLLLTLYDEAPEGFLQALAASFSLLKEGYSLETIVCQHRYSRQYELSPLAGESPQNLYARRGEIKFNLSQKQQNIGYFLDIEPLRLWLERRVQNKRVLNLFAFTCSFSVLAKYSGADSVINVDISSNVLNKGRDNHRLNSVSTEGVKFLAHDVLRSWGKLRKLGPYDIVIVDPPSFQKGSFVAVKDYQKILRKLPSLLCDGGYAILCLNAPEISGGEFQEWVSSCGLPLQLCEVLSPHKDFADAGEAPLKMHIYSLGVGLELPYL